MFPFLAHAMLDAPVPNGSGLTRPPLAGARKGRTGSCACARPSTINSLPSGERSYEAIEATPSSGTGSHFAVSRRAQRYILLSVAAVSVVAYSHFPSGENRTVPPVAAVWVGPSPPASTGRRVAAPLSTSTNRNVRTPFSIAPTASDFPSGDQSHAHPSAIRCSAPPSAGITYTAQLRPETALRNRLKAMRRPSGAKIGPVS